MKIAKFSRLGFVVAAAGSAVGLGNVWKFPYITGEYGGGAFVLVYLLTVAFVGFSVLIGEILIGSLGKKDVVASFEELAPSKKTTWRYAGFMGFTGLVIMSFYSVVIGWILHYIYLSLSGALPTDMTEAEGVFTGLIGKQIGFEIFWHFITAVLIFLVVVKGIKGGIERANKILMPSLFLMILGLLFYSMSLEGFSKSFDFLFAFDFSKLNSEAFVQAVGHSFFTLSLGMGAILTYSASLPKGTNIFKAALSITFLDTIIALMAGLMMFAFLFEFGKDPSSGPGLVFMSLPVVFSNFGVLGQIFAFIFFLSLAFAGLTSAISITEPTVQYLIDKYDHSRKKATLCTTAFFFVFGLFALLSYSKDFGSMFTFGGMALFDILDKLTTNFLLPFGGIVIAFFIGFVMQKERVHSALKNHISDRVFNTWYFSIRYIAIIALIFTLLNLVGIIKL